MTRDVVAALDSGLDGRALCRCRSPVRARRCAQLRLRHVLGNPLGADPRLRDLGSRAGGRLQGGDAAPAPRRLAALARDRLRARRRHILVLLRGRRDGSFRLSQGRRFHGGDGVRVRGHQPRDRARDRDGRPARLAVHARRVRRRAAHDRHPRASSSAASSPAGSSPRRRSRPTVACSARWRATRRWTCPSRGHDLGAPALAQGLHRRRQLLRHGLGGDLEGHLRRSPDRGRARRLGAELLLGVLLLRRPPDVRQVLGPARRPARRRRSPSSARSETSRLRPSSGTGASASAA